MAFVKDTIKLGAAKKVFDGARIEAVEINNRVAYYRIAFGGWVVEDTSLTEACRLMWLKVSDMWQMANSQEDY